LRSGTCCGTHHGVIKSFADKLTAAVFEGRTPKGFPTDILAAARRKLAIIDAAEELEDTNTPPGNRLEALKGDREGRHSIRINGQWRVCFVWKDGSAYDVEIVDYH
jgi:toxin HigB-1